MPSAPHSPWRRRVLALLLLIVLLGGGWYLLYGRGGVRPEMRETQYVRIALAELRDIPQYYQGLGTVTPQSTVLVKSRVDGQLMALHFTEGQRVREGDLLAEIDSRPFEAQLKQAEGALARDAALLQNARADLARYQKLIREQSVSAQQLQNQESLVGQYEGAVLIDQGNITAAKLQIEYCRITAPISGRVGLRRVDLGNMIRASDASGITVITQTRPIQVIFTLVEKEIPDVLRAVREARRATPPEKLPVEVWDQDGKTLIATGELLTLDNQIDTTTGTVRAKAVFENVDEALFPNQFVNARLRVRMLQQALVIPVSAVQRDNKGFFVYTVNATKAAQVHPVTTGYTFGGVTVVEKGLTPGDIVVTDGVDRLRQGTQVKYDEGK